MALRVLVCLLAIPGIVARFPLSAEARVRNFLLNQANFSARDRPVLNSTQSIDVKIRVSFFSLLDLNEKDEVITTASWLTLRWTDERLGWDPEDFDGVDLVPIQLDEIWTPKLIIIDSLEDDASGLLSPQRGSILLSSEGDIYLGTSLVQSTNCPLSIRYFPYDSQVCPFQFIPANQLAEQVILTLEPDPNQSNISTSEWTLVDTYGTNYVIPLVNYTGNRPISHISVSTLCIHIERDPRYYISALIVPSSIMCLLSLMTFLAPTDSGERISLGVSIVLGLTVFQLLVADTLPTASKESPILGQYLEFNFIMACLAVPSSLGNINIAYGDTKIPLMKYGWVRRLFLVILPRILNLPTYEERLYKENRTEVEPRSPMGNEEELEVEDVSPMKTPKRARVAPVSTTLPVARDELTKCEKVKLEARTVALVLDRLSWICFLLVFCGYSVSVIVKYQNNPGPLIGNCLSPA